MCLGSARAHDSARRESSSPEAADGERYRILIVDDDASVCRLIADVAGSAGHESVQASSGVEAIEACQSAAPDIVLLDLMLPGMHGLDVCRELRRFFRGAIVVLSGCDDENTVARALDLGADDYLCKPFRVRELLARIRAVGRRVVGPRPLKSLEAGAFRIDFEQHRLYRNGLEVRLTPTEFKLVDYLLRNRGRVVTTAEVLERIWGARHDGYTQTLRVHVGHIRDKIEDDRRAPRHLLTEPGIGFRFEPGNEDHGATTHVRRGNPPDDPSADGGATDSRSSESTGSSQARSLPD